MKTLSYWLLVILFCCCNRSKLSIDANNLIGTWRLQSSTGRSETRWTFDASYLYIAYDSSATCRPAEGQPWEYKVTGNTLNARYAGISNGLVPIPDTHFLISTLSENTLIIENKGVDQLHFDKCK
jgi:hypothetical protein